MGRSGKHSSKKHKHSREQSSKKLNVGPVDGKKVLKYASLGKTRKLRTLLADKQQDVASLLSSITDSGGATPLHQAARHGQLDTVELLLRRSADASACDHAGNTPGHLAAMHGHWLVLTALVKAADIDLDKTNAAGFTVRDIVQQQQDATGVTQPTAPRSGSPDRSSSPSSSMNSGEVAPPAHATKPVSSQRRWTGGAAREDEEDDWLDKLAYEMCYDDPSSWQGAWGSAMAAAAATPAGEPRSGPGRHPSKRAVRSSYKLQAAAAGADEEDDDDAWADRLWQDMQEHRRQAASAKVSGGSRPGSTGLFGSGSGWDKALRERERKAAAAAAESARILKEEQAKDADWRAAMMRQVEEASLPLRRPTYEQRWQQLEAWPADKPICYADIPWPCPAPGSQAAARKPQRHQALQLDRKQLQTLVLAGAQSAADIKLALRREILRWHPDKFTARYGARLAAADRDDIHAGVHAVAQQLTALKQQ